MAAVPACCREFEDPVDPKLLLESLLSKLFPFLKDRFIVPASSSSAAAAAALSLLSPTAPKKPSNDWSLFHRRQKEHQRSIDHKIHNLLRRTHARGRQVGVRRGRPPARDEGQRPCLKAPFSDFPSLFPDFSALNSRSLCCFFHAPSSLLPPRPTTAVAVTLSLASFLSITTRRLSCHCGP